MITIDHPQTEKWVIIYDDDTGGVEQVLTVKPTQRMDSGRTNVDAFDTMELCQDAVVSKHDQEFWDNLLEN